MADSLITITVGLHEAPATVAERCLRTAEAGNARLAAKLLADELLALASGVRDGAFIARVDSLTRGTASATIVVTQADCTAGDTITITIPGRGAATLTAVSGAVTTQATQYSIDTSDTAVGDSIEAAINANPLLSRWLTATNDAGTVTIAPQLPGTWAHGIYIATVEDTSTALVVTQMAGGDDVLTQPSITVTFGTADITADDTIAIGRRKYTWKASASGDGEITLSTTPATAATNFAAAINADATWTGLLSASRDDAVVTLTWLGDPRAGQHIVCDFTETNAGSVVLGGTVIVGTGEAFTLGTTATGSSTARTFDGKGAA